MGSIVAYANTIKSEPVAGVAITAQRFANCDANTPVGQTYRGTSDASGHVYFYDLPLGCYFVPAIAPAGYDLLDPKAFDLTLTDADPDWTPTFRLEADQSTDPCSAETIGRDLGYQNYPYVEYCDGSWAAFHFDGDAGERIANRGGDKWALVSENASSICLATFNRQGMPAALDTYFDQDC